ncbi:MAG: pyrimidine reductase family protein [Actinomycetota bacterium]|nr:pyrimidine reductase family protein [Actinomycetota bacterium]
MALRLLLGGPDAIPQQVPITDPESLEALYQAPRPGWVRANVVVSLDAAVEIGGRSGPLGGPDDRLVFVALRALADVVLVGSGTARAENYGPAKVSPPARGRRVERGQAPAPPVAVLTNRADLDPQSRLFTETATAPRPLVLTCARASPDARSALSQRADVVLCGDDAVDLAVALDELGARGLRHVLCEGGPTTVTGLIAAGALDELCVTQDPIVAGPGHLGLMAGTPLAAPVPARLVHLLASDRLLLGRYYLRPEVAIDD